jgi:AraC family transcriptional regulator
MRSQRIQILTKGRRIPFFKSPELCSSDNPWAGYHFEESQARNEPITRGCFSKTTLFLCTGGQGTAHRKHRGVWDKNEIRPGSVFIVRRDTEIEAAWASEPWPTMLLQIDNSSFQRSAPDEINSIEKTLVSALTTYDERLASLMMEMRTEVKNGCSSGRLYGESLSLALLAYLASTYATPGNTGDRDVKLSPAHQRRIVEYIAANLATNISVTELAELAQMSTSHFARSFKLSFGVTPYRYVMQERVEGAKHMLTNTKFTASDVAMAFGFSSLSHFVKVFRQFTGVSPKQYKSGF